MAGDGHTLRGEFAGLRHIVDGTDVIAFANVGTTTTIVGRRVVRIQDDGFGVIRYCFVDLALEVVRVTAVVIGDDVLALCLIIAEQPLMRRLWSLPSQAIAFVICW